jgi:K+-transporting ATPase ATPase F chain
MRAVGVESERWRRDMTFDYAIGLLVTAGLLVYLTYALLRPEKF